MIKKLVGILVCMLVFVGTVFATLVSSDGIQKSGDCSPTPMDVSGSIDYPNIDDPIMGPPQHIPPPAPGPDSDWDFWSNPPHIFLIPLGNVGIGTASPQAKVHVENGSVFFSGSDGGTPVSGPGTRLMWIPSKAAFRAGYVDGSQWDDANIGQYSAAIGYIPQASGLYSSAMGCRCDAFGLASTAIGYQTTASGQFSIAMGKWTEANNGCSIALGYDSIVSGDSSVSIGPSSIVNGHNSTVLGSDMTVNGNFSIGIGLDTFCPDNKVVAQDHVMSIMGGNVGIGTTNPNATLEVKGTMKVFGEWNDTLTNDTVYTAESDGFVFARIETSINFIAYGSIFGYTEKSNPPYKCRGTATIYPGVGIYEDSFLMPIKKGEHWRVTTIDRGSEHCGVSISWLPLGT